MRLAVLAIIAALCSCGTLGCQRDTPGPATDIVLKLTMSEWAGGVNPADRERYDRETKEYDEALRESPISTLLFRSPPEEPPVVHGTDRLTVDWAAPSVGMDGSTVVDAQTRVVLSVPTRIPVRFSVGNERARIPLQELRLEPGNGGSLLVSRPRSAMHMRGSRPGAEASNRGEDLVG